MSNELIERLNNATIRFGTETELEATTRRNKTISEAAQAIADLTAENERLRGVWNAIAELTTGANSITMLPVNEEADHKSEQIGVDCCGDWTDWQDRRFMAETHIDAVFAARAALKGE